MPSTRYGVATWVHEFAKTRRPDWPALKGERRCPVVIVGGGLSGCMTAYAFAAAGVPVTVLEANRLGLTAGGLGPGVLQGEPPAGFRDLDERYGRKAARALYDGSRRAVLDLAATARRLGLRGVATHDALRVAAGPGSDDRLLAREASARRDAGLDAVWLKAAAAVRESAVEGARGAVRLHTWGHANPYALVTGFAEAAAARGAEFCERSPVTRITPDRHGLTVHTARGTVRAATVAVCTGEPTPLFRPLARHFRRDERYVVVTERVPAAIRKRLSAHPAIVVDTDVPPHTVRWSDDERLVVAGADQARPATRGRDKILVQRTGQLMYELSRLYPVISGVLPAYGWHLPIGVTSDGVMCAGPHRNYPHHLFVWGTQHDPAAAFLASRILLRHHLGAPDHDDGYFGFSRSRTV